jgi:UDP-glucose 4-epimerase
VPHFVKGVLSGASVIVHGDGSQTRDFVYIDDVVAALVAAANAPEVDRTTINIGSGEEVSINTLIAELGRVMQRQTEVIYNPQDAGGIARLVADLTAARRLLGYKPQVTLREGLGRLLVEDARFARSAMGQVSWNGRSATRVAAK